jgi:hypothetical protein
MSIIGGDHGANEIEHVAIYLGDGTSRFAPLGWPASIGEFPRDLEIRGVIGPRDEAFSKQG